MAGVQLRAASEAELARIYSPPEAEHIVAAVDGEAVAWIGFRPVDEQMWGMFGMLVAAPHSVCVRLFYQFRKRLQQKNETVNVLANDASAERLLRLLGFQPTGDVSVGKRVWQWKPQR